MPFPRMPKFISITSLLLNIFFFFIYHIHLTGTYMISLTMSDEVQQAVKVTVTMSNVALLSEGS